MSGFAPRHKKATDVCPIEQNLLEIYPRYICSSAKSEVDPVNCVWEHYVYMYSQQPITVPIAMCSLFYNHDFF